MASNPFYVEPGNQFGNQLAGLGAVIGDYRQKVESEERKREAEGAIKGAYRSGDPNAIAETMIQYPEYRDTLSSLYGFKSDATKQNAIDTYKSVLANKQNPQGALDALNARIDYVTAQGGDPSNVTVKARDQLQSLIASGQDPSSFFRGAELDYAGIASPQEWNAYSSSSAQQGLTPYQQARLDLDKAKLEFEKSKLSGGGALTPDLRQKINKDVTPLVKDTESIYGAAKSLESLESSSSPASQLAAVFKFMKSLDPTSAVRESEQGMVYDAQGAAAGLAGRINKLMGEGGLTKEGFRDVVNTAKTLANSAIDDKSSEIQRYIDVYEGTLPEGFVNKVKSRVPKKLEVKDSPKTTGSMTLGINQQSSSSGWSIRPLGQ